MTALPALGARRRAALPGVRTATRGPILAGIAVIAVGFGGFGAWAALAPLHSAAVAPGVVTVEGNRRTVQHLEGGIIEAILVRDGDTVDAGQVLLRLDETRARAALNRLTGRYRALHALEARLFAERDGLDRIRFPATLREQRGDPDVDEVIAGQDRLFEVRRAVLVGQTVAVRRRIAQYEEEIVGREAQVTAAERRLAALREELDGLERLFAAGNAPKPRLLELRRRVAEVEGERGENLALIARARQQIAEAEQQIVDLGARRLNEVVDELRRVQADLLDQRERLRDAEDVLARLAVRAPRAGVVVGLKFHTPGGVIGPGEPILDLVPQDEPLLIEARVRPEDIDVVHPGLRAQVRLTAYSARRTPTLEGEVVRLSADRLVEPHSGAPYYAVRVEVDPVSLADFPEVELYPGMPAEVLIVTGEGTALRYLIAPLTDGLARAWREP